MSADFKTVKITPLFKKQFKDFHNNEQKIIDGYIEELKKDPTVGEDLSGDVLKGCKSIPISNRVAGNCRLIYRIVNPNTDNKLIHLIAVGAHRNIYDIATRYLRDTGLFQNPT